MNLKVEQRDAVGYLLDGNDVLAVFPMGFGTNLISNSLSLRPTPISTHKEPVVELFFNNNNNNNDNNNNTNHNHNNNEDMIKNKRLTDAEVDDIKTNTIQTNTSPTPRIEQTQSTGANEPEIPSERSEIVHVVDPQNTETINLDEKVLEMKVDILRKWEVVKEQAMAERPSLKKINKDRRGREAITTANSALLKLERTSMHHSL